MEFPKSAISMVIEEGTGKPCRICKWVTGGVTNPKEGRCTVNRTTTGAIWQRLIRDIDSTSCERFEKGTLSFTDNA